MTDDTLQRSAVAFSSLRVSVKAIPTASSKTRREAFLFGLSCGGRFKKVKKMQVDLKKYKNRHSIKNKVGRMAWNAVWLLFARWTPERGFKVFDAWRIMLLRLFGAKIGNNCRVFPSSKVWAPWNLEMMDSSSLGEEVFCYNVSPVKIGENATVSREVFLCTASHDVHSPIFELKTRPIVIAQSAWIAARAIILPGVTVGEGAVVGAGALVAKDVPAWKIFGSVAAKEIGERVL